ncbi:MAG: glycosyltransferase [Clostridiales bacterium]|nr:glycosyltransferase [Clostridiales bacterium]
MAKKNVAIIIQTLQGGGAERTASNLSECLSKDYNVHLIAFDGKNIKYPYQGKLYDLKLPPTENKIRKLITAIKRIQAVRRIKKENHIAASISLMDGANLINVLSKKRETVITSVRIQMSSSRFKTPLMKRCNINLMQMIGRRSDYVVALSQGVNDDLVLNFGLAPKKVVTIYNPCDGELLKQKALIHMQDASHMPEQSIVTMGRATEQKGQWHLIRAFSLVLQKSPHAHLYILGDGPLKEKLKQLSQDMGINERVHFMGFVEAPHAYIMKSKLFVFPSLYEGLGNALLEAMSCGTPCIAADCYSGPREILAPGTKVKETLDSVEYAQYGILTSVCDKGHFNAEDPLTAGEKQLADAIVEMLTSEETYKRYREAAMQRIKDFTPEKITGDWKSLIENPK